MPQDSNLGNVEIGHPRDADELDAMLQVMCAVFELPYSAAREVFYNDPYFDPQNKLVLRAGGQVVSCLSLIPTQCWINDGVAALTGIAGVATLPEERRKGYAGALLNHAIAILHERGIALAGLLPYDFDFYRKFGFEQVGLATRQSVAVSALPPFPQRAHVRPLRDDDIPALEERWNDEARGQTLHCLRDTKRWRALLASGRQAVVYEKPGQGITGYLLYTIRPGSTTSIYPPQKTLPALCVQEFVGLKEARRGLFGWLSTQTQVSTIEFQQESNQISTVSLIDDFDFALRGRHNTDVVLTIERAPAAMLRVVSLRQTLQALADDWRSSLEREKRIKSSFRQYQGQRGTLLCVMRDPLKPDGRENVVIEGGEDDLLHLRTPDANETFADMVEGTVSVWSQAVTGYFPASDALTLGLLTASTPHAAKWAGRLLCGRFPFLPVPDYF